MVPILLKTPFAIQILLLILSRTDCWKCNCHIDLLTGLPLDFETLSNFCHKCTVGPKENEADYEDWRRKHAPICNLGATYAMCKKIYLCTLLTEIIRAIYESGRILEESKRARTVLIHKKKGNNDDPTNFGPITLESVPFKVYTSSLCNANLSKGGFIEQQVQKGFAHRVSGTLEHTSMMAHIINNAHLKQRSVVITFLECFWQIQP